MYRCLSCKREINVDIKKVKTIRCPLCGHKVIEKVRPKMVKRVEAV